MHLYGIQNVQNDKLYPMRDVKIAGETGILLHKYQKNLDLSPFMPCSASRKFVQSQRIVILKDQKAGNPVLVCVCVCVCVQI